MMIIYRVTMLTDIGDGTVGSYTKEKSDRAYSSNFFIIVMAAVNNALLGKTGEY